MTSPGLPGPPAAAPDPATGVHGPYESPPEETLIGPARRAGLLDAALAGVARGAWDRRILAWLCHWCDTPTFLAVLGLLQRARTAGAAARLAPDPGDPAAPHPTAGER